MKRNTQTNNRLNPVELFRVWQHNSYYPTQVYFFNDTQKVIKLTIDYK